MRILLASLPQALGLRLHTLLQREPWVTTVSLADGQTDTAGSYEPWRLALGRVAAGPELVSQVGAARADIVVLDWRLAQALPWGTLESLRSCYPATGLIAINVAPQERAEAYGAGVDLLLAPAERPEEIVISLRTLWAGALPAATG